MFLRAWVNRVVSVNWKDRGPTIFLEYQATTFHSPSSVWVKAILFVHLTVDSKRAGNVGSWTDETLTAFLQLSATLISMTTSHISPTRSNADGLSSGTSGIALSCERTITKTFCSSQPRNAIKTFGESSAVRKVLRRLLCSRERQLYLRITF